MLCSVVFSKRLLSGLYLQLVIGAKKHTEADIWNALNSIAPPFIRDHVAYEHKYDSTTARQQRVVHAAIVGYPNAGKSELTNTFVGATISAVSSKRNTTIEAHRGVFVVGNTQVVLHDTPGIVHSSQRLTTGYTQRVRSAWLTAAQCEVILFLVDANKQLVRQDPQVYRLAELLRHGPGPRMLHKWVPPPVSLVLNKVDRIDPDLRAEAVAQLEQRFRTACDFDRAFSVSALRHWHTDELKHYLCGKAQPGPWPFPEGQVTDLTPSELSVELVREKLYRRLNQAVPYRLHPRVVECSEGPQGGLIIKQELVVESAALKGIVVGAGGAVVQQYVVARAQRELTKMLKRPVRLDLDVRVKAA